MRDKSYIVVAIILVFVGFLPSSLNGKVVHVDEHTLVLKQQKIDFLQKELGIAVVSSKVGKSGSNQESLAFTEKERELDRASHLNLIKKSVTGALLLACSAMIALSFLQKPEISQAFRVSAISLGMLLCACIALSATTSIPNSSRLVLSMPLFLIGLHFLSSRLKRISATFLAMSVLSVGYLLALSPTNMISLFALASLTSALCLAVSGSSEVVPVRDESIKLKPLQAFGIAIVAYALLAGILNIQKPQVKESMVVGKELPFAHQSPINEWIMITSSTCGACKAAKKQLVAHEVNIQEFDREQAIALGLMQRSDSVATPTFIKITTDRKITYAQIGWPNSPSDQLHLLETLKSTN